MEISSLISKSDFLKAYGLWGVNRYKKFIDHIEEKFGELIDYETSMESLSIKATWKDSGGNTHASVHGFVSRRDQTSKCGGEIVWLKRLGTFRGNCWSCLEPKSDFEYFEEARELFYSHQYRKFLVISKFIEIKYQGNCRFKRMCEIAKSRV
ncbi:TPA: hypothetical protein NKR60_001192 [Vibrio parahaemolyticus]|nr:hypothetical protein [Vibrio parahaemolyticus]